MFSSSDDPFTALGIVCGETGSDVKGARRERRRRKCAHRAPRGGGRGSGGMPPPRRRAGHTPRHARRTVAASSPGSCAQALVVPEADPAPLARRPLPSGRRRAVADAKRREGPSAECAARQGRQSRALGAEKGRGRARKSPTAGAAQRPPATRSTGSHRRRVGGVDLAGLGAQVVLPPAGRVGSMPTAARTHL